MAEENKEVVVDITKEAVCNPKNFSNIPNSNAQFCIYTYKAETETYAEVTTGSFFNTAYTFLMPGDTIRVFIFNEKKALTNYLEFVVMDVDKLLRKVKTANIVNINVQKKIVE